MLCTVKGELGIGVEFPISRSYVLESNLWAMHIPGNINLAYPNLSIFIFSRENNDAVEKTIDFSAILYWELTPKNWHDEYCKIPRRVDTMCHVRRTVSRRFFYTIIALSSYYSVITIVLLIVSAS